MSNSFTAHYERRRRDQSFLLRTGPGSFFFGCRCCYRILPATDRRSNLPAIARADGVFFLFYGSITDATSVGGGMDDSLLLANRFFNKKRIVRVVRAFSLIRSEFVNGVHR